MRPALRLAIAQQAMCWSAEENALRIAASLSLSAEQGARICVFPELALTGFHRGIREQAKPPIVTSALQTVRAACRTHAIACTLGTPSFDADGAILNSYLLLDSSGSTQLHTIKNGLTASEQTFFKAGTRRPVGPFEGRRCTTIFCREMADLDAIATQMASESPDLVFWPSLVGHPPGTILDTEEDTNDLGYVKRAARVAHALKSHVVQSNWPNALNTPDSTYLGESKVYAPNGDILLTLQRDQAGVAVFALGERTHRWTTLPF